MSYHPKAGTWSDGPPLPGEKSNGFTPASAVAGGRLYVTPADGKLYRLSDNGDRWEEAGKVREPRFVARMVPGRDNRLVVIAGAAPGTLLASVEAVETGGGQARPWGRSLTWTSDSDIRTSPTRDRCSSACTMNPFHRGCL